MRRAPRKSAAFCVTFCSRSMSTIPAHNGSGKQQYLIGRCLSLITLALCCLRVVCHGCNLCLKIAMDKPETPCLALLRQVVVAPNRTRRLESCISPLIIEV